MCHLQKSLIRQQFHPTLHNPVFVEGLPGFGDVGKIASELLISFSEAKLFAEYYSPSFPDYVTTDNQGICSPPHYELYASSPKKLSAVILTGDSHPPLDNVEAHYNICDEILDFAQNLGCTQVITIGGVPVSTNKGDVYVAATSRKLAAETMTKGGIIYGKGRIMGATGLLLGLARERGLSGICLLGATDGMGSDKEAGSGVFQLLLKILGHQSSPAM